MIRLSQKWFYTLSALVFIAWQDRLVKIKDIVIEQNMSESLLRRIIADLEKEGIIESFRGRNGGIKLAKSPEHITLFSIFKAVGEEIGIRDCTKWIICNKKNQCQTAPIFFRLQKGFNSLLQIYTLKQAMGEED